METLYDIETYINKFAQGIIQKDELYQWFDNHNIDERKTIMNMAWSFLQNTHPTNEEIEFGIMSSGLRESYTAAVIFRKYTLKEAYHKLKSLHDDEINKTFIFICSIFKTSDTRRRNKECKGNCTHSWHHLTI